MEQEFSPEILERLRKLQDKYEASGQDMVSYLDGLIHANYLTYWDYIHVDTLLTLQKPRTDFPDEVIFIVYHQITELYFLLIHRELDQLLAIKPAETDKHSVVKRLQRVNNYLRHLTSSFDIMTYGMDHQQFLNFRMTLLPASGFQTASFREIEFKMTGLNELINFDHRANLPENASPEDLYEHVYWKSGNVELASGRKTLTLRMFEQRYDEQFRNLVQEMEGRHLRAFRLALPAGIANDPDVLEQYRKMDLNMNVFWRLSHYRAAARYLQRDPDVIKATGGTNWMQYLPPRFQRVIFFPELWNEQEKTEWGKAWVMELFKEQVESQWSGRLRETQD